MTFTIRHAATARSIDRTTAHLTFQALHDNLTGLGNRALLERALTEPDRASSLVLVELVGLDDINDVLGVSAGDAVIAAAAREVGLVAEGSAATRSAPPATRSRSCSPATPPRSCATPNASSRPSPRPRDGSRRGAVPAVGRRGRRELPVR